ncbi:MULTISPECIES: N-acetylneuraminate synthase family protein [Psychrobacillus]|uniref:N-acetylneuraminate synthase family protein n=1 Tax=Psychrobacillus TaxID=1221880 RepID=UPI0008ED6D16|nr:N-acetylneuraminate synthase family protein [Psychrobacillus psychrodurans]MCZ8539202.1 N-acetylneuraminate synthase family protein [Psychrobacillus psychrodurans]SFM33877.1 N-acetylneuraminate synthase/N,N'-diacetyllegionaminate synthase [Psychrobacillus psychrodurans]
MFNKSIRISDRVIDSQSPVFIIAEIGVNHNGNIDLAKRMIDEASEAKVDAVKFQSFYPEELLIYNASKAPYQLRTTNKKESQLEMLENLMLTVDEMVELKSYVETKGLIFLSTPFEEKSLYDLEKMDIDAFKISSTDTTNLLFLKKVARLGKPILLSTGMCTSEEITEALHVIRSEGNTDVILLHCTSNYPTPIDEVNMKVIPNLAEDFQIIMGYSDHTEGVGIAPFTVPLGVKVIEKHFTLDKTMEGPDHLASLDKNELISLVETIRFVEASLGDGIKKPTSSEKVTKNNMQKKLVLAKEINESEILTEDFLTAKRSDIGIPANKVFNYIGKRVKTSLSINHILKEDDIYEL